MSSEFKAIVSYDWDATEPSEMSIKAGETLTITSVNERGWALAQTEAGSTGWVPFDFLNKVEEVNSSDATDAVASVNSALQQLDIANQSVQAAASPAGTTEESCFTCQKSLAGSAALTAKGRQFHPDCFTCCECQTSLAAIGFLEKDDKYFCEKDYYKVFGHVCHHCKETIIGSHIMGNGRPYHVDHLLCAVCTNSIGTDLLHVKDDQTICHSCYNARFAVKCVECGEAIEHQVFTALDKSYHKECFKCAFDGHAMADDAFHVHEDKIYCPVHFKQMFGKQCAGCEQQIEGQYLQVLDKYFHADCWKCTACAAMLNSTGCVKRNEKFYCPPCGSKVAVTTPKPTAPASAAPAAASPTPAPAPAPVPASSSPTAEEMRKQVLAAAAAAEAAAAPVEVLPVQDHYTLEQLQQNDGLPPGVNRNKKEDYLNDADFASVLKMSRQEFADLKAWKQAEIKKAAKIF